MTNQIVRTAQQLVTRVATYSRELVIAIGNFPARISSRDQSLLGRKCLLNGCDGQVRAQVESPRLMIA